LFHIANKILFLKEFYDSRLIEKILIVVLEIYETFITSLKNTKDLSTTILIEIIHALQAQEQ